MFKKYRQYLEKDLFFVKLRHYSSLAFESFEPLSLNQEGAEATKKASFNYVCMFNGIINYRFIAPCAIKETFD